ncbi:MAG: hypothetical protein AB7U62_09320 [Pseudolabrys sp.]
MTALSADRNTPRFQGDVKVALAAASQKFFAGGIVMRNASGYAVKGATATSQVGIGRADEQVDNSTGSAGDKSVKVRPGVHRFANSTSGDLITIADIGKPCFTVDDQTVAKTNGTNTRSIAGFIYDVDDLGVWVEFNEARVQSHLAGIA